MQKKRSTIILKIVFQLVYTMFYCDILLVGNLQWLNLVLRSVVIRLELATIVPHSFVVPIYKLN